MRYSDAVLSFVVATAVAAAATPLAARLARRLGAVDLPRERGLSQRPTPLLGGLAILAAVLVAGLIWLPPKIFLPHVLHGPRGPGGVVHMWAVIAGACLITLVGAIDDVRELPPAVKLAGQIAAALIAVEGGAVVTSVTLPFIGHPLTFPNAGGVLTVIWLVGLMNVVNFSDGVDGLAAGLCTIDGVAFAIIAFDLGVHGAPILAAITAGGALGFLFHNFYPASVFMGDAGANLLGYLLGVTAVVGSLKTNAVVALIVPLTILVIPFLDTSFVIARRLKYRRKPWSADDNHFHHRMARIGFSQRKTVVLPLRVVVPDGRSGGHAPHRLPPSPPSGRLDRRAHGPGGGVRRRQRLPHLRAGDLQVQGPAHDRDAPRQPGRQRGRHRRPGGQGHRDRRV